MIPSLHAAGPSGSLRVGARLYLPDSWTDAPERPKKAEVPDGVTYCTKWELMMGLLEEATQTSPGAASEDAPLERWVYLAKLRWRVERDYQEMKTEVGLNHYAVDPSTRGLHFGGGPGCDQVAVAPLPRGHDVSVPSPSEPSLPSQISSA